MMINLIIFQLFQTLHSMILSWGVYFVQVFGIVILSVNRVTCLYWMELAEHVSNQQKKRTIHEFPRFFTEVVRESSLVCSWISMVLDITIFSNPSIP